MLSRAAANGLAKAQYEYGVLLIDRGQMAEGTKWMRLSADQHYGRANEDMFALQSEKYAKEMSQVELTEAANSGNAMAMRVIGIELKPGGKFATDTSAALDWEMQAAMRNDPVSEYNVGYELWAGKGRTKNAALGVKWLLKSAEAGFPKAQAAIGLAYAQGDGIGKDPALAVKWYECAVRQGSFLAADMLGDMYLNGRGVHRDLVKAVELFDVAARQNDSYGIDQYMKLFSESGVAYANGKIIVLE